MPKANTATKPAATVTAPLTKSQTVAADVSALLRARNPLLWVVTNEEARVERFVAEAAASAGYNTITWDVAQGCAEIGGNKINDIDADPDATLGAIEQAAKDGARKRNVWIMRDLPPWLAGPASAITLRRLRNLARTLPSVERDKAQAVVVLSPSSELPPELRGHTTVIDWPLPDRAEIAARLDVVLETLPDELKAKAAPNGTRDAAIDAAVGLSDEEAAACYARSLVQKRVIDPAIVASEKKLVITREKVLEWYDPLPGGLDSVGGLDNLKAWLVRRRAAYSPAARAYGLPAPKGAMLVGVSGCGKSLTAKAIATAWGVPLLRLDLNALKSSLVGSSEANIRKAFAVIEAIGRCVVWIDEVEKAMQGATSGSIDGGVSADALGAFLNWMQERKGEAFVIATANDVRSLPPEFLRKGRFDEVWFVDLPNATERAAVLAATLRSYKRADVIDASGLAKVAAATDRFTGSEIAALVPDALFAAFDDDQREITTADLLNAAVDVTPLAETAGEKIAELRNWAKGKARMATSNATAAANVTALDTTAKKTRGRQLDLS